MMEDSTSTISNESVLAWPDWVIIGTMLIASGCIGLYSKFAGGHQKTSEEYFFAHRSVGIMTLALTMMMSYFPAILMLSNSGGNYSAGVVVNGLYLASILGTPIAAYCYLPVFYNLKVMSVYEYLERRFGVASRLMASSIYLLLYNFSMGAAVYAPALALQSITGLGIIASILLFGLTCTFYTSIGGLKAVIITHALQNTFMVISSCAVATIALDSIQGGIGGVFNIAQEGERLNMNFEFDPTIQNSWWSLAIGGIVVFLSAFGCGQVEVQRLLSARSLGDAQKALWIHIVLTAMNVVGFAFAGLVLYALYVHCDPFTAGEINSYDMVMPYFVKNNLVRIPGLTGIFVAGVFSGALSMVSAIMNSLSAIVVADYIQPLHRVLGYELSESKITFYGMISTIMIGVMGLNIAILTPSFESLISMIEQTNVVIGGPILGLFTLGMFSESANEIGAIIGTIIAIMGNVWWIISPKPFSTPVLPMSIDACVNITDYSQNHINGTEDASEYFYFSRISYFWISAVGMSTTMTIGTIVSIVVQKCSGISPPMMDANLFTPFLAARIRRRRENEAKSGNLFVLDTRSFEHQ